MPICIRDLMVTSKVGLDLFLALHLSLPLKFAEQKMQRHEILGSFVTPLATKVVS